MLTRNRILGASLALGLLAVVAVLAVTGGHKAVAQPPTANDRFDEILDELIRIRSEVSDLRAELTLTRGELTDVRAELAVVNARLQRLARTTRVAEADPAEYTKAYVLAAIDRYETTGREATIAHYNTAASVDGQWYMFIADEQDVLIASAASPSSVGLTPDGILGPNGYPAGEAVAAVARANPDGAWLEYAFPNPASGRYETKNTWVMVHDGLVFGSGWYEPGPSKADQSGFTKSYVDQAINLYEAVGLERTLEYYNSPESVDGRWHMFIADPDGILIAHPVIPENVGKHILGKVGVDPMTDRPYGLEILAANDQGRWVRYNFLYDPHTGATERKNSWIIRHDDLIFGSGWYGIAPDVIGLPATGDRTVPAGWLIAIGLGGLFALAAGVGTVALQRRRSRAGAR
jgi:hypothetical protein